jgi:hypothetical protein
MSKAIDISATLTPDQRKAVDEIKAIIRPLLVTAGGVTCPTCHQKAKTYARVLDKEVVLLLVLLYKRFGTTESFNLNQDGYAVWSDAGIEHAPPKATHMLSERGLLAQVTEVSEVANDDGTTSEIEVTVKGVYYVSALGEKFLNGEEKVPSHSYWYGHRSLGLDPAMTFSVDEALECRFDLSAVLGAADPMPVLIAAPRVKRPRRKRR